MSNLPNSFNHSSDLCPSRTSNNAMRLRTLAARLPATTCFIAAVLGSASLVHAQSWENVVSTTDANAGGIAGAVWVPNQYNNPTIDSNGAITFRGQLGGAGITTANSKLFMRGTAGNFVTVARDGSAVPGGTPSGYVFNTTAGINGLAANNNPTANGGMIVSGNINGAGVTATTDSAMYFVDSAGVGTLLARESDALPGGGGAIMTTTMTAGSGQQTSNSGETIFSVTMTGGDVSGTTNNTAVVTFSPTGTRVICRKGSAAPGFTDGTTITPDAFGLNVMTGGHVEFGATLAGGAVTTANDKVRVTSLGAAAGGLRIYCREGFPVPGMTGVNFKSTASFSNATRSMTADGHILFSASLEGTDITTLNDGAVFSEFNGSMEVLLRKGQSIPSITDLIFQGVNTTSFGMTADGTLWFQGILMNLDGTGVATTGPGTFVGRRGTDGVVSVFARALDAVPGLSGVTYSGMNGNTSLCACEAGVCVFQNSTSAVLVTTFAWDATAGTRVIARAGDTNFTGTAANQFTLIGSTGNNGNGGSTGISPNGWLTMKVRDSVASIDTIARINLGPVAPPCTADVNNDGTVNGGDLASVLAQWGTSGDADVDGSGTVDGVDLAIVLGGWGDC